MAAQSDLPPTPTHNRYLVTSDDKVPSNNAGEFEPFGSSYVRLADFPDSVRDILAVFDTAGDSTTVGDGRLSVLELSNAARDYKRQKDEKSLFKKIALTLGVAVFFLVILNAVIVSVLVDKAVTTDAHNGRLVDDDGRTLKTMSDKASVGRLDQTALRLAAVPLANYATLPTADLAAVMTGYKPIRVRQTRNSNKKLSVVYRSFFPSSYDRSVAKPRVLTINTLSGHVLKVGSGWVNLTNPGSLTIVTVRAPSNSTATAKRGRRMAGLMEKEEAAESPIQDDADPCAPVCPVGICDSMADIKKPECAACVTCQTGGDSASEASSLTSAPTSEASSLPTSDGLSEEPAVSSEEQMAEDKAEFGEGFTQIDDDHNGHVSDEELGDFLRSHGDNPTKAELEDIENEVDQDGNHEIEFSEYCDVLRPDKDEMQETEDEESKELFYFADVGGNGFISPSELETAMEIDGNELSTAEVDELMHEGDEDGDGQLNMKEMEKMIE